MVLTLAGTVVALAGLKLSSAIVAPILLALFLMVCFRPLGAWMEARRVPRVVSIVSTIVVIYGVLFVLGLCIYLAVARFAITVSQQSGKVIAFWQWVSGLLQSVGVATTDTRAMLNLVSPERLAEPGPVAAERLRVADLDAGLSGRAGLLHGPGRRQLLHPAPGRGALPAGDAASAGGLRQDDPQLLRGGGHLRRDRGRPRLDPAARPGRTERLAVGAAGLRHEFRPERGLPARADPARHRVAADGGLAARPDHRDRLLGDQRRGADPHPAGRGRRPGPAQHDPDVRGAGGVDLHAGRVSGQSWRSR